MKMSVREPDHESGFFYFFRSPLAPTGLGFWALRFTLFRTFTDGRIDPAAAVLRAVLRAVLSAAGPSRLSVFSSVF